MYLPDPGT
jgi:hypothetical protein